MKEINVIEWYWTVISADKQSLKISFSLTVRVSDLELLGQFLLTLCPTTFSMCSATKSFQREYNCGSYSCLLTSFLINLMPPQILCHKTFPSWNLFLFLTHLSILPSFRSVSQPAHKYLLSIYYMPDTENKINSKEPALEDKRQLNKMITSWIKCCKRKKQTSAERAEHRSGCFCFG